MLSKIIILVISALLFTGGIANLNQGRPKVYVHIAGMIFWGSVFITCITNGATHILMNISVDIAVILILVFTHNTRNTRGALECYIIMALEIIHKVLMAESINNQMWTRAIMVTLVTYTLSAVVGIIIGKISANKS